MLNDYLRSKMSKIYKGVYILNSSNAEKTIESNDCFKNIALKKNINLICYQKDKSFFSSSLDVNNGYISSFSGSEFECFVETVEIAITMRAIQKQNIEHEVPCLKISDLFVCFDFLNLFGEQTINKDNYMLINRFCKVIEAGSELGIQFYGVNIPPMMSEILDNQQPNKSI